LAINEEIMTKVLLIGKNGQLAGAIVKNAHAFDLDIFPFDKSELDVTEASQVEKKIEEIKPNVVINTSAFHVVPKCEELPFDAMAINFFAVGEIAKICKKYKIAFITYSTDYVFDGKKGVPYNETDSPHPLQTYGMSKLAGEYACLRSYPEGSFVIRTCGLYGGKTGSPEKGGNFVLNILKEAQGKDSIEVSSEQIVSPTYAGDLSKTTLELLSRKAEPGIYHLANEGSCSWHEFTKEIFRIAGIKTKVIPVDRGGASGAMMRPKVSALKNVKAKAIGIELPSWKEGLKSYFEELSKAE
jgi:dTDP-4-dehydrorhamnose reductase